MIKPAIPDFLSHYYEREHGPFRNLSHLALPEAENLLTRIRQQGDVFASQRAPDYLAVRRDLEDQVREKFIAKGGAPVLARPHYMILGASPWLCGWYRQGEEIRIPLAHFDLASLSFTYGDTFPAMRYPDGKPYRGQVYTWGELPGLIQEFGLPQVVNPQGKFGPDRYIEAQVWDEAVIKEFLIPIESEGE